MNTEIILIFLLIVICIYTEIRFYYIEKNLRLMKTVNFIHNGHIISIATEIIKLGGFETEVKELNEKLNKEKNDTN